MGDPLNTLGGYSFSALCRTMACFERNLHTQISGGDSILSSSFCGITLWTIHFCSMTHYDFTITNDVTRDVYCDIIMGHDVAMDTYHDVIMQTVLLGCSLMYYYTQL